MIGNAKDRVFAVRGVETSCQPPRSPPMRGIRTDLTTYLRGATALAEGLRIRATGRLWGVDQDTANHWLPVLGQHCQSVMNDFFRNLHLHECQLDELWTFIHKKEDHLTSLEKLAEVSGDAWCDAVVVKARAHSRVVHVTTRIVYGTTVQVEAALRASPVSRVIKTSGVERNNLTIRQHTRRIGRKV